MWVRAEGRVRVRVDRHMSYSLSRDRASVFKALFTNPLSGRDASCGSLCVCCPPTLHCHGTSVLCRCTELPSPPRLQILRLWLVRHLLNEENYRQQWQDSLSPEMSSPSRRASTAPLLRSCSADSSHRIVIEPHFQED
jgi:hypothetical protein